MPRPRGEAEKSKDFGKAIKRVIKELKNFRVMAIIAVLIAAISSVVSIMVPNMLSNLTDKIAEGLRMDMDFNAIWSMTIMIALFQIGSAIAGVVEGFLMTDVSNRFAQELRDRISEKINRLPLKFFDKNQTGDTLSRVTNDVDTIAQSLNESLSTIVAAIALFIGVVIMMFVTNWVMALTAIISGLIGFFFVSIVLKKSQKYFTARQKELGNINSHIEEIYSGLNVVKAYNGQKEADKEFDRLNQKVYDANRKSQFLSGLMPPMMMFIGNLGYVAFIIYVRMFTSPLTQIAQSLNYLQSCAAAAERVFEFLDEAEMPEQHPTQVLERDKVRGMIEFRHVKFGYDENKLIIKDFSALAKSGQKIAIVGPTGAGKTTMVNLLMRFYEINSGSIYIDGVPISELSRENVRSLFTMVLQDTWLFAGTVRDNIVYNRKGVSDEQVWNVCDRVGLSHFVKTLPKGLDSDITESESVSAGQRQLITIARGMIEDAPFLILDEATSNVDTRTEELVQKAMDKLMHGRTSFIIAHRLSTIKNADLILVMKDGNIVETGKHDELIKKNGFYAELYNSQFQIS